MNIVLFNGPPRSGKDTAVEAFREDESVNWLKDGFAMDRMSMPIKQAFGGVVDKYCDSRGVVQDWEQIKDQPHDLLSGKSYRQWQIDFSEKFMKPLYGEDIFARLFADRWKDQEEPVTILVPDCGFEIEKAGLRKYMPNAKIALVRIIREGTDFSKDSRGYLNFIGVDYPIDIYNNGTVPEFQAKVMDFVRSLP